MLIFTDISKDRPASRFDEIGSMSYTLFPKKKTKISIHPMICEETLYQSKIQFQFSVFSFLILKFHNIQDYISKQH